MSATRRKHDRPLSPSAPESRPTNPTVASLSDRVGRRDHPSRAQIAKRLRGAHPISSSSISSLTELAAAQHSSVSASNNPAALRRHRRRASESVVPTMYLPHHKRPNSQQHMSSAPVPLHTKRCPLALDHFALNKMLGSGGTATVFRAEVLPSSLAASYIPTTELALKAVSKKGLTRRAQHYLAREIAIHRNLQHENIAALYEVFEDSAGIYLAMELLRGNDLYTALKRERAGFPEPLALQVCAQVLNALRYMHSLGYAHRDVKPENIMFTEKPFYADGKLSSVKLIDFGLASARDPNASDKEKLSSEKCGTVRYAAPEIVTETSYVPELCDIWSVGVVLYSIIAHRNPYTGRTEREVLHQIANTPLSFNTPEWERVSNDTKHFIRSCLSLKPSDRPNAARALEEVTRIMNALADKQVGDSFASQHRHADMRSSAKRGQRELFREDVSGFSSHVTPDAGASNSRRRDGSSTGDGSDPPSNNSGDGSAHPTNFLDGLLAWFSGGSTPERNGSESPQ
ncbi:Serine/threonine protein kinase Rhodoplastic [Gracilaria domingensis]|nr:Serine/threonine protein kinase Rhodoplastic [Gracilaria domingensis]